MLIPPLLQVRGKTPRLARLISAVGAIFDCRSISDLANSRPGEPKRLCLQAASHCRDALCVWRELASTPALAEHRPQSDESAAAEAQECRLRMSETLVLLGRSLCNYGLDGDGEDMSAVAAFEEAEVDPGQEVLNVVAMVVVVHFMAIAVHRNVLNVTNL